MYGSYISRVALSGSPPTALYMGSGYDLASGIVAAGDSIYFDNAAGAWRICK